MNILYCAAALIITNALLFGKHECYVAKDVSSQIMPLHRIAEAHLASMNDQELNEDWKLNEFFGVIKVINDRRNAKGLASIARELESIGVFDFDVVAALDGRTLEPALQKKCEGHQPEEAGRYMTHYTIVKNVKSHFEQAVLDFYRTQVARDAAALEQAREDLHRYRSVLILKDNVGFGAGMGRLLRDALRDLPDNWDMVYFYAIPYQPVESITPLVQRLNKSYYDVAYAVNYRMYGPLCHHLKKIEEPDMPEVRHIDHQISHIHKDYNVFSILVPLVYLKE